MMEGSDSEGSYGEEQNQNYDHDEQENFDISGNYS